MKKVFTKIIPILLLLCIVFCFSGCDLEKFWGYVTGDSVGSFGGVDDDSDLVYNQGTIGSADNPLADTIEEVVPCVVDVVCDATYIPFVGNYKLIELIGSGVIIDADDEYVYVVASYQSVYFAESMAIDGVTYHLNGVKAKVKFMDGVMVDATYVALLPSADTGLLKVKKDGLTSQYSIAKLPSEAISEGDDLIAVSNPLGVLGGTVTTGIVSALRNMELNDYVTMPVIQTDAEITINSGGILFNFNGEFVGVIYAKAIGTGIEGLNFAIPVDKILDTYHQNGLLSGVVIGE